MNRYESRDCEDAVEIEDGTFRTFTRGTREPLYVGTDATAARESLEMVPLAWDELLMSDPV